ncbi:hypothetical protein AB4Y87_19980 [Paenarthrobacter sp. RAF54_2]|uniref:hypothetical protein n=1 Tax=Paenarthrobacter sp. RAF54_2 TaxID=3233061 RepID=UPI003F999869
MLENPGAYDQEEFDALVHESDLTRILESLDEGDYILVPEEPLWSPYDGRVSASVFLQSKPSWWIRYFDYL